MSFILSITCESNQSTRLGKEEWDALSRKGISDKGKQLPESQSTTQEGILEQQSKIKDAGDRAKKQLETRIFLCLSVCDETIY